MFGSVARPADALNSLMALPSTSVLSRATNTRSANKSVEPGGDGGGTRSSELAGGGITEPVFVKDGRPNSVALSCPNSGSANGGTCMRGSIFWRGEVG